MFRLHLKDLMSVLYASHNSFSVIGPSPWNGLPLTLRLLTRNNVLFLQTS